VKHAGCFHFLRKAAREFAAETNWDRSKQNEKMKRSNLMNYGLTASITLVSSLASCAWAEIQTTGVIGAPKSHQGNE